LWKNLHPNHKKLYREKSEVLKSLQEEMQINNARLSITLKVSQQHTEELVKDAEE
jgi:hypothetical protein